MAQQSQSPLIYWTGRVQPSREKYMRGRPNPDASVAWPENEVKGMIDNLGRLSRENKYARCSVEHISKDSGSVVAMWLDKEGDTWAAGVVSDPQDVADLRQAIASNRKSGRPLYGISPMHQHMEEKDAEGRVLATRNFAIHHVALVKEPDMAEFGTYVDYATEDGHEFVKNLAQRYRNGEMAYLSKQDRASFELGETCQKQILACRTEVENGHFRPENPDTATLTWAVLPSSKDGVAGKLQESRIGHLMMETGYVPLSSDGKTLELNFPVKALAAAGTAAAQTPPAQAQEQIPTSAQTFQSQPSAMPPSNGPLMQHAASLTGSQSFFQPAPLSTTRMDPTGAPAQPAQPATPQAPPPGNQAPPATSQPAAPAKPTPPAAATPAQDDDAMDVDTPATPNQPAKSPAVGDQGRQNGTAKRKDSPVAEDENKADANPAKRPAKEIAAVPLADASRKFEELEAQVKALMNMLRATTEQPQQPVAQPPISPPAAQNQQPMGLPQQPAQPAMDPRQANPAMPDPAAAVNGILEELKRTEAERQQTLKHNEELRKTWEQERLKYQQEMAESHKKIQAMEPALKMFETLQQQKEREAQQEKQQLEREHQARMKAINEILDGRIDEIQEYADAYNMATTAAQKRKTGQKMENMAALVAASHTNVNKHAVALMITERYQYHLKNLMANAPAAEVANAPALTAASSNTPAAPAGQQPQQPAMALAGAPGAGTNPGAGAHHYMEDGGVPTRSQLQAHYDRQQRVQPLSNDFDPESPEGRAELVRRALALSNARVDLQEVDKVAASIAKTLIVPNIRDLAPVVDPFVGKVRQAPKSTDTLANVLASCGGARLDLALAATGTGHQALKSAQNALTKSIAAASAQGQGRLAAASAGASNTNSNTTTTTVMASSFDQLEQKLKDLTLAKMQPTNVAASTSYSPFASDPYQANVAASAPAPMAPQTTQWLQSARNTPASTLLTPVVARTMLAKVGASAVRPGSYGINPYHNPMDSVDEEALLGPMLLAVGVGRAMAVAQKLRDPQLASQYVGEREARKSDPRLGIKRTLASKGTPYTGWGQNPDIENAKDYVQLSSLVGDKKMSYYQGGWDSEYAYEGPTWIPDHLHADMGRYM